MQTELPDTFEWVKRIRKYEDNPILRPQGRGYAADNIFNPAAVVYQGRVGLLCRCINMARRPKGNNWSVSSFGWAWSDDGFHFELDESPVPEFDVDEKSPYQGGFEDPRLVKIGDEWVLTYTGVHDMKHTPGMIAFSKDLKHWELGGEVLPGRAIAIVNQKIGGRYWAYWGNHNLELAWSEDLRHWHVNETPAVTCREGFFDEHTCEAAAAPIVTDDGILLFYNGAVYSHEKAKAFARAKLTYLSELPHWYYQPGWVLFDRNDPTKVTARCTEPILAPDCLFEQLGMVPYTVFAQGYVQFKGKHILYYGCADQKIGAAYAEFK